VVLVDSPLEDKELFEKLEQGGLVEALKSDPRWKILKDCLTRSADKWMDYFLFKMDSRNIADIETVRAMVRIYKYDLFKGFEILTQEGEIAFEELKYRNQIRLPETEIQDSEDTHS
jgi:hypothetical protein